MHLQYINMSEKAILISSNSTLLYRLFLPAFGTVLLGALTIAAWNDRDGGFLADTLPVPVGNMIFTGFFLLWIWFVFSKLWTLRRIESDGQSLFVSDYWTHIKYPFSDIEQITERKRLWISMASIVLKGKGRFGKTLRIIKGKDANAFIEQWRAAQN